jgi:hypothetical protein
MKLVFEIKIKTEPVRTQASIIVAAAIAFYAASTLAKTEVYSDSPSVCLSCVRDHTDHHR